MYDYAYESCEGLVGRRSAVGPWSIGLRDFSESRNKHTMKSSILVALSVVGVAGAALAITKGGLCGEQCAIAAMFRGPSTPVVAVEPAPTVVAAAFEEAAADEWTIDGVHSSMVFRIKHMNTAWFYGRFNDISGTINFNKDKPDGAAFSVEIKSASVDTNNKGRDKHLMGSDFFNADQFPTCTFKSTGLTAGTNDMFELKGDLTLNGQTKPITAKLERTGEGKARDGAATVGFEAVFTINRQDFGIKYGPGALGDEVKITIALEAVSKK